MSKISVITPPDKLYNKAYSFVLIFPNEEIKLQLQNLIQDWNEPVNVYLYEPESPEWLIDVVQGADTVILNVDEADAQIRELTSYLISLPNVFWLTKEAETVYTNLSGNRIYDLSFLTTGDFCES